MNIPIRIKRIVPLVGSFFVVFSLFTPPTFAASAPVTIIGDDFNDSTTNSSIWHIPTWTGPTDGTYIGRTQFRVTQNSPLPATANSNVNINVQTYNPTGFSFYGTDLISNTSFYNMSGSEFFIETRAKFDGTYPGVVGGIFLYGLKSGSNTLHDEIDFELLGNKPTQVQTNIYDNEPLGAGHPQLITLPNSGTISGYHTYRIHWLPNMVSWYIDGIPVRTETNYVPAGLMYFHLNMWAPDSGWAEAYSPSIQPTSLPGSNQIFSMSVDYINVTRIRHIRHKL